MLGGTFDRDHWPQSAADDVTIIHHLCKLSRQALANNACWHQWLSNQFREVFKPHFPCATCVIHSSRTLFDSILPSLRAGLSWGLWLTINLANTTATQQAQNTIPSWHTLSSYVYFHCHKFILYTTLLSQISITCRPTTVLPSAMKSSLIFDASKFSCNAPAQGKVIHKVNKEYDIKLEILQMP